jgi:hypothetical protein
MAAIELKRLLIAVLVLATEGGEGLDRRGRQRKQQLGEMGTSAHVGEHLADGAPEAAQQIEPDQASIGRPDRVAGAGYGTQSEQASTAMIENDLSIVTRTSKSCIGSPTLRTPEARG